VHGLVVCSFGLQYLVLLSKAIGLFAVCTMSWTPEQRAHAFEVCILKGTVVAARRALGQEWGRRCLPTVRTMKRWLGDFRAGRVPGVRSHRVRGSGLEPAVLKRIRRSVARNSNLSVRKLAQRSEARQTTVWRYLRRQLGLFPYKVELTHALKRGDQAKRQRFCRWLLGKWGSPRFRNSLLVSNEAHFYLNGLINKQNCRVWGLEAPQAPVEVDQQSPH